VFHFFHEDANHIDTPVGDCFSCFTNLMEIMSKVAPVPTARNFAIFTRRHRADGKIIESLDTIALDFGVSPMTVRFVVRSMWRRLNAYHLRKCQGIRFA
jgi:hypothetical protein